MKTLLTGIKPTGHPHLGNYVGAILPAIEEIQKIQGESYLFIADHHALTTLDQKENIKNLTYKVASCWLACGLDPSKTIFYKQSDIPELFELHWILSCLTPKGLMNRAHSYKAHTQINIQQNKKDIDAGISMGLFNYPILMAADILLFQGNLIPVGEDQKQHLEITRDLATKFNIRFKTSIMKLPEPLLQKKRSSLPGIDGRKMSKSYNNDIPLFCSDDELRKKISKIKTDSLPAHASKDVEKSILFQIYQAFASRQASLDLKIKMKKGISWKEVKDELFELIHHHFKDQRPTYLSLMSQTSKVDQILKEGAQKARVKSKTMLQKIRKAMQL